MCSLFTVINFFLPNNPVLEVALDHRGMLRVILKSFILNIKMCDVFKPDQTCFLNHGMLIIFSSKILFINKQ